MKTNLFNFTKKNILSFLILFCFFSSAFAEKSRFYENKKVINTMYINSPEGLKVREKQDLKSNRICSVCHRFPVKIVAIGKEVTIDGITDPWIEILLPRYLWKSNNTPEYGWVFGGYLSKERPAFSIPETTSQTVDFLRFYNWQLGKNSYVAFERDNYYKEGLWGTGFGQNGKWYMTDKSTINITMRVYGYGDDDSYLDINNNYNLEILDEYTILFGDKKLISSFCYRDMSFEESCIYSYDINGNNFIQALEKLYSDEPDCFEVKQNYTKEYFKEAIISGIDASGTSYMNDYETYWAPIMKEHQKMAKK